MNSVYLYLGIYLITLFSIVFFVSKKEKKENYLIAGRNRKWYTIMFSKFASSIGISWFISYTAYAYEFGFWIYSVILGTICGYLLFVYLIVPKIYEISKANKFYTLGDLVYFFTSNKNTKNISNIFSAFIQFLWLILGIIGGSKIVESLGIMSYELSLIIIIIITFSYIIIGGFKVVLFTDIFQSFIVIFFLFIIVKVLINGTPINEIIQVQSENMPISMIFGFFLFGMFAFINQSDRYQLCYAARSLKNAKKGFILAIIPIIFSATLLLTLGLYMYIQNPNLDPGVVFFEAVIYNLSNNFLPIVFVLFFAGIMSSVDTYTYAISSHLESYISKKYSHIARTRIVILLLMLITFLACFLFRDIVEVTIIAAAATLVLSFPLLYVIMGGKKGKKFIYSFVGSIIGFILGISFIGLNPSAAIIVLLFSGLFLLIPVKEHLKDKI